MIPGDPSCYRGTDVLVNKHDLRDPDMASAVEYKFAFARELELEVEPIQGKFDFAHLQAIHKHVFQDTYEWAGELRSLDFAKRSKDTGMVTRFTKLDQVGKKIHEFNQFMEDNKQLKDLPKAEFVKKFAEVHTKLNEIHPFREGNGRSTRIFMRQLAKEAGHELRIDKLDKDQWNLASHKAQTQHDPKNANNVQRGSQTLIREVLEKSTRPTVEHAFKHEAREVATKLYPGLKDYFEKMDTIAEKAKNLGDPAKAEQLVATAKQHLADKLKSDRETLEQWSALEKLSEVRPGFDQIYGKSGDYQIVASTMKEVFTKQGHSPEAIDGTLQRRFGIGQDQGKGTKPSPGQDYER